MNENAKQPKKIVLSVRVNEAEWKHLQKALRNQATDVSTLLRNGIHDFIRAARSD